jgi:hypothetical protein
MNEATVTETAEVDPFGADWDRPRWTNRLTWVLVAAVVASLAFAGGLLVERQYDSTLVAGSRGGARATTGGLGLPGVGGGARGGGARSAATGAGGRGGAGAGAAGGGAGAGGGAASGGSGSAAGGAAGAGAGGGADAAAAGGDAAAGTAGAGARAAGGDAAGGDAAGGDAPIAVGTLASVAADRLTLTNFAGKTITVAVPPTTTVTTSGLAGLKPGAPVSVTGTANPDGSVTATSVTSRTAGG